MKNQKKKKIILPRQEIYKNREIMKKVQEILDRLENNVETDEIKRMVQILEAMKEIILLYGFEPSIWFDETEEEIISELDNHIQKILHKDFSKFPELILLFAPTVSLQEMSISGGWGWAYLKVAEKFDLVKKQIIKRFQLNIKYS